MYVPPTLAVLTAAPRAFAVSCQRATLGGNVADSVPPYVGIDGAMVRVHCNPSLSTTTTTIGGMKSEIIKLPNIPYGTWETEVSAPDYQTLKKSILYEECKVNYYAHLQKL